MIGEEFERVVRSCRFLDIMSEALSENFGSGPHGAGKILELLTPTEPEEVAKFLSRPRQATH